MGLNAQLEPDCVPRGTVAQTSRRINDSFSTKVQFALFKQHGGQKGHCWAFVSQILLSLSIGGMRGMRGLLWGAAQEMNNYLHHEQSESQHCLITSASMKPCCGVRLILTQIPLCNLYLAFQKELKQASKVWHEKVCEASTQVPTMDAKK